VFFAVDDTIGHIASEWGSHSLVVSVPMKILHIPLLCKN